MPCVLQSPDNIIENCVFDGCNSDAADQADAICNMIESYEAECNNMGIKVKSWRRADFCRKHYSFQQLLYFRLYFIGTQIT